MNHRAKRGFSLRLLVSSTVPQGTLFERNATGGTGLLFPKKPTKMAVVRRNTFALGAIALATCLPISPIYAQDPEAAPEGDGIADIIAQTLNYAEGSDPSPDPADTDVVAAGKRRYVRTGGNNNLNGLTDATAWASISKVNSEISAGNITAGTYVLFRRGDTFSGDLKPNGLAGSDGNRIVFGAYGAGFSNGDGDPFNDLRPLIQSRVLFDGAASQWVTIRDLNCYKISPAGGGADNDLLFYNNVVHGNPVAGSNNANLIGIGDDVTRVAIVQNLVYDGQTSSGGNTDLITLHSSGGVRSVGSSHWIVDNVLIGNDTIEAAIDVQIGDEEESPPANQDYKVIGNRINMTAGTFPGITQLYSGTGDVSIQGAHVGKHLWIMGNMATNSWRIGMQTGGLKEYYQISGNILWRNGTSTSSSDDRDSVELTGDDIVFEHNTILHTQTATRYPLQLRSYTTNLGFLYQALSTTVLRNLFVRANDGRWFDAWSTAPTALSASNYNWYGWLGGTAITGDIDGQTFSGWQGPGFGFDLNGNTGNVPGVSVPSTNTTDQNPLNWYGSIFLDYFTPTTAWTGNSMGDGTPAGALKSDGVWYGGGPSMGGTVLSSKWVPSQMRAFPTLGINSGYGWAGPLIVQQRYPLPNAQTPAAPTNLSAIPFSSTQINLAWTDNASNETGFEIDRKTGAGGTYAQIATTSAVGGTGGTGTFNNDTGLSPSTLYYYRIRATNGTDSPPSNEASAMTLTATTVTVSATDSSASEAGLATGTFTFTRTGSTAASLAANFTLTGSTATSGSDYASLGTSVTFNAGSATAVKTVTPIQDVTPESTETVIVTLATGTGYSVGSPNTATVNIADNDSIVAPITYQAEALTRTTSTGDSTALITPAGVSGSAVRFNGNAVGDWVQFTANVATAGTHNVKVQVHRNDFRAISRLLVDGVQLGSAYDAHVPAASAGVVEVDFGNITLTAGNHTFRFEITGRNAASLATDYQLAIDYLKL